MRITAPRERRDHDTTRVRAAALALLLATLPWHVATAQTATPCTAIENDAERLACYDRALRGTPPAPAERAAPAEPPIRTVPAEIAAEPRRERRVRESTAPSAPAAPVAGSRIDEQIAPLVIVSVRALPGRDTLFTAEDGSTWVQTDSQRIAALPDTPFTAELKSGAMGSYFLLPKEGARAIRVRRAR